MDEIPRLFPLRTLRRDLREEIRVNWRQVAVTAIVLGVVAGMVVWYLERFESNRLMGEIHDYLGKRELFDQWLRERGEA